MIWRFAAGSGESAGPGPILRWHLRRVLIAGLFFLAGLGLANPALSAPTGGKVTAGSGRITQSGSTTTISQQSQNLSVNWKSFDVAPKETVDFSQPNTSAIAVNRIFSNTGSQILGHLNANGQVYLINPNGVLFGKSAVVNVGGLVASTLNLSDEGLLRSTRTFSGTGTGSVINQGAITAATGGTVALLGQTVSNQGTITAKLGTVALGAGTAMTLTFDGNQLVNLEVTRSTLNDLAENKQLVVADGGQVMMTAGAKDSLLASAVNNTGIVEAQTVKDHNGVITLCGDIVIKAAGDFENSGNIETDGGNNLNAGNIDIEAGKDVKLDSGSLISASGQGENSNGGNINILAKGDGELSSGAQVAATGGNISGNGGAVDFSADETLNLDGGIVKAGAVAGSAGTVTFDPTDLTISANDTPNDGSSLHFLADDTITVNSGVTISSRQVGSGTNALTSPSTGPSGDISFKAPQITVNNGARILATATGAFSPGNITLTAEQTSEDSAAVANVGITIGNATLSGGNITLTATSDATADNSVNPYVETILNDAHLGFLINGPADALTANATSTITVGNSSAGNATLNATGNVTIASQANSDTSVSLVGAPDNVAYGESNATATATVGSTANIKAGGSFDMSAKTQDHLDLLSQTAISSPANVAVSFGKAASTSNAEVDGSVTAEDIKIETENENKFATEAKGFNNTGGGTSAGGVGVALGFYQSNATTTVPGELTADNGNVDISASSTNDENATRSESEVTDKTDKTAIENSFVPFLGTLNSFIQSHSSSETKPESNPNQFGLAAAVSYMSSSNTSSADVSGSVAADKGGVSIDGTATDNPKISAAGSSDGANDTIGGGVAIGNFTNASGATISGDANVTAADNVDVTSDSEIPNPVETGFDELAKKFDFTGIDFSKNIVTSAGDGWGQSLWNDIQALYTGVKGVQSDVKNPGAFFTSFTNTALSAEGSGTAGLAGSVDMTGISNTANANISGTANVTSDTGDVSVGSTANATVINVAGMAFDLNGILQGELNPGVTAGSSLGGTYEQITFKNSSTSYIGDNTKVEATKGSVDVNSDAETFALDVGQSGDKAEKFGVTGVFDLLNINNSSQAYIRSDATVLAGQNVNVDATNNLNDFLVDGALGMGGTAQVGVTIGWNQINSTTLAYIGDPNDARSSISSGSGVTAGGDVNVKAKSKENVYAISFAATKSGSSGEGADGESSSQPKGEVAPSNSGESGSGGASPGTAAEGGNGAGGGEYGFGISGNIAFNQIKDGSGGPGVDTEAFINNGAKVNATGNINLSASDTSFVVAAGVAATLGQTLSLAGAYSQNSFIKQVEAYAENANLLGNGLNVISQDQGDLFDISAGGGLNTEQGIAIAGSVNNNSISNTTEAYLGDGATAYGFGAGGINLNAQEGAGAGGDKTVSVAGGFGIALDGGGVGAGVDIGNYNNTVKASVESGADVSSTGNTQITADTNIFLIPVAVSLAAGSDFGAAGSFAYEQLTNTTTGSIGGMLATDGNLLIGSHDATNVIIIGGGVGIGGDVGFGVTGIIPAIDRTTTASIGDNATVRALGSDASPLTYDGQSFVGMLLDAGSSGSLSDLAIAASGSEVAGVAGAVIINPFFRTDDTNTLNDDTEATIGSDVLVNGDNSGAASDQSVMLEASDSTGILDVAGALGAGGEGGVGVGFDMVIPAWTVETGIGRGATVNAADDLIISSTLNNSLQSYALAIAASLNVEDEVPVSFSGAGAASNINVTTNTDAYVNGTVNAGGNVEVAANRNTSSLNALDGNAAVAISLGAGFGVSLSNITTNDTVDASIGGTGNVTALGNGPLDVPNGQLDGTGNPETSAFQGVSVTAMSHSSINPITAGVAGSGVLGGQGSVIINNLTETTKAHVNSGAKVNVDGDTGASDSQSVQVLATDKTDLNSIAGGLSLGGLALTASVDTDTVNRTADSYISGATVNASSNVLVVANMLGSITSTAVAGSVGGFSGAGAVSTINETTHTDAFVDGDANVTSGSNVDILANRDTSLTTRDGGVAVSGTLGANGSVSTVNKTDYVNAYVGADTNVTALGNGAGLSVPVDNSGSESIATVHGLSVAALGNETMQTIAIGAAVTGGFAGSGSVTTNNVTENTRAVIDGGATINGNNTGAATTQGVNILAYDKTNLTSADGAAAVALTVGAGIGAALDFGNVQKTTTAAIQNGAYVTAQGAVNVDALSVEALHSYQAAVGGSIGAGLAGTTADYYTHPIITNTTAYVGSSGSPSGATINVGSLGLDANDNLTLGIITGELSLGGAALGAGTLEVQVNGTTNAYIGALSNLTTDPGGVTVNSTYTDSLSGTAVAGSGGAVAGDAAYASITDNHNNYASINDGVTGTSVGDDKVTATTTRNLGDETYGLAVGGIAAGADISRVSITGSTSSTVGQDVHIQANSLNISADDNGTASATGTAITGGIGSGQYNQAKSNIGGTVTASIGNNANVDVTQDFSLAASGENNVSATIHGVNAGGLTVGVDRGEAVATPTVTASVGDNETIHAGRDLNVKATYNASQVSAYGSMSSGSLANIGVTTSYAHANDSPTVSANVGDAFNSSSSLGSDHDLTVSSTSNTNAKANFNGVAISGVNVPGDTESIANINNTNSLSVSPNVTLAAGNNLLLSAVSSNLIPYATVTGTNAGLISIGSGSNGATAKACINSPSSGGYSGTDGGTSVTVNTGDMLTAGNSATLQALSGDSANDVNATSTVVAGIGTNNNNADVIINDNPTVSVDGAGIQSPSVTLEAELTKMLVNAKADSITAAADSYSNANSTVTVIGDPAVHLVDAEVNGSNKITITALVSSDSSQVNTTNLATAKINGFTGSITAEATNNTTYNPVAIIDANSHLTTEDLVIEVESPLPSGNTNAYYSNNANAVNNSVVSWTLTTVQVVVDKVFGWIPFIGSLIKKVTETVTKWVKTITNSDTNNRIYGDFNSSPSVVMNGTVYQSGGANPSLVASTNSSGNVIFPVDVNVEATVSGNTITVGDLTNSLKPEITINAPSGTVSGNFTVHRNTTWTNVDITNNTNDNLVINGIQPEATNLGSADVNITAGTNSSNVTFVTDVTSTDIKILNNSGSNVTFNGFVNNSSGSLEGVNVGGDILGTSTGLLKENSLTLSAGGDIGTASSYLNTQLESLDSSGASLQLRAGGNLFFNADLVQDMASAPSAGYSIPGGLNVNSLQVDGNVNLNLLQPEALVAQTDYISEPSPVNGVYNINNTFSAGGDVNLNVTGPMLNLNGLLSSGGSTSISVTGGSIYSAGGGQLIRADGISFSTPDGQIGTNAMPVNIDLTAGTVGAFAEGDINLTATAGNLLTGLINSTTGHVNLVAQSGDVEVGTVESTAGITAIAASGSIVDADDSGVSDINANTINLMAQNGSIGTDANALDIVTPNPLTSWSKQNTNITEVIGPFNVSTVASGNGNVTLTALAGDINLGTVNALQGVASLNAFGSILDGDAAPTSDINANSINLTVQNGSIGTVANPLQIDSSYSAPGLVSAASDGDVNLNEVVGNFNVGSITSSTGNIILTAPDGDVTLGTISSMAGSTTIIAGGSILDTAGEPNVTAININLTAQNGSIGTEADPVTIDSSNASPGLLTALAEQDANITETSGVLNVNTVTAETGNVRLKTLAGDVNLGTVNATVGTASIVSSDSIIDGDAAPASDINANSINLTAQNGSIGTVANPLQIDSSYSAPGLVNGWAEGNVTLNEVAGPLNVGTITSNSGNINLTVPDGDANLGTVNSTSGTTNISVSGSILNASNPAAGNINAVDTNLNAVNGSIGTISSMLTIDSSNDTPGMVNALANLGIYLDELHGPLNVNLIRSATSDIVITSDGSILNASTPATNPAGVNLIGNNITLVSINGGIGQAGTRLVVDNRNAVGGTLGSNYLDMNAQGDIYVNEVTGNLLSHLISSTNGDVDLLVSDGNGNLDQLVGNKKVVVLVQGDLLDINRITGPAATADKAASPENVSLTVNQAGGTLNVNQMDVDNSVMTRADNTNLLQVFHTNLSTPTLDTDLQANALHFDDAGYAGGVANSVNINVAPCSGGSATLPVIFDNLTTMTANVNASVNWLEFINAVVGTSANIRNNYYDLKLTSKTSKHKQFTPWYLFILGDHMATDIRPVMHVDKNFIDVNNRAVYNQPIGQIFKDILTSYGFRPS